MRNIFTIPPSHHYNPHESDCNGENHYKTYEKTCNNFMRSGHRFLRTVIRTTVPVIATGPALSGVEVAIDPSLDTPYLVEIPPTLFSEDEDVRPLWLMTAVNSFLRLLPCIGSLGKVIDLYLAQDARLGYPELVCVLVLPFYYPS